MRNGTCYHRPDIKNLYNNMFYLSLTPEGDVTVGNRLLSVGLNVLILKLAVVIQFGFVQLVLINFNRKMTIILIA